MSTLEIRFTQHASGKFELFGHYGFQITRDAVVEAVQEPDRVDLRGEQRLALKVLDEAHALRVVYEERNGYYLIITFYPVRRDRHGI